VTVEFVPVTMAIAVALGMARRLAVERGRELRQRGGGRGVKESKREK